MQHLITETDPPLSEQLGRLRHSLIEWQFSESAAEAVALKVADYLLSEGVL